MAGLVCNGGNQKPLSVYKIEKKKKLGELKCSELLPYTAWLNVKQEKISILEEFW